MTPDPSAPVLTGRLTVDAIAGRYARVEREDGEAEDWFLASLPHGVREGDVLRVQVEEGDLTTSPPRLTRRPSGNVVRPPRPSSTP